MKTKCILLILILLTAANTSEAQKRRGAHSRVFDLELRGGLNFCQIDGDASGGYNKIGYHGGINTSFALSDDANWRFVVELGLTQKGSHINNSSLNRQISLLYVEVPLMLAYDLTDSKQLRIAAGVAPAILAKAKVNTDGAYDALHSDNYKRLDALPVCVSLRYRFSEHIGADLRYYNSMLNIAKENGSGTYRISRNNKGQFNNLLQAGLTIDF